MILTHKQYKQHRSSITDGGFVKVAEAASTSAHGCSRRRCDAARFPPSEASRRAHHWLVTRHQLQDSHTHRFQTYDLGMRPLYQPLQLSTAEQNNTVKSGFSFL